MKRYKKYYKGIETAIIPSKDLKPFIEKIIPKIEHGCIHISIDFKTNKITLKDFNMVSFVNSMKGKEETSLLKKYFYHLLWFLEYKCKIQRAPNRKALNTLMIEQVAIRMLTKKDSHTYLKAEQKCELLYGIINSKGLKQPVHIMEVGYIGSFTTFLSYVGLHNKATKLWDIWMKSKFKDSDRRKFRKASEKQLLSMIEVKK